MNAEVPGEVTKELVETLLDVRRQRADMFGEDLFSDPAWDILLELFAAELSNRRLSLDQVGRAMPRSTVARWVAALEEKGLVGVETDPDEAGKIWVSLSRDCSARMKRFLSAARHLAQLV